MGISLHGPPMGNCEKYWKEGCGNEASLIIKCDTEEKTPVHVLCQCEAFTLLRHAYLGSCFLDPEDFMNRYIGAIQNFSKGTGLL